MVIGLHDYRVTGLQVVMVVMVVMGLILSLHVHEGGGGEKKIAPNQPKRALKSRNDGKI